MCTYTYHISIQDPDSVVGQYENREYTGNQMKTKLKELQETNP
jgi:hypothetical protein